MALVNRYILVEYDVGGPRLWHERWALEHVGGDSYIVVTPDRDIYSEDLGLLNSDLRGIRVRPAPGVVPPGGECSRDLCAAHVECRRGAGHSR